MVRVSNHPDAPASQASKVASRLVAMVAPSRNQITVVAKIRAIWKTTISALAMREEPADRDAAARIANL
jgi:hypothetical protein